MEKTIGSANIQD